MTDENTQFNNVCKGLFDEIKNTLKSIDDRLFHDNGNRSYQSRFNDIETWQKEHDKKDNPDSGISVVWFVKNWRTVIVGIMIVSWFFSTLTGKVNKFTPEQVKQIAMQVQQVQNPVPITNTTDDKEVK